jgi:hypothetical protein
MSRGLGKIQRECLRVIAGYNIARAEPTTFNVAAEVYRVKRDSRGNRTISDAQHVAIKTRTRWSATQGSRCRQTGCCDRG